MEYYHCPICGLSLPITVLVPVGVRTPEGIKRVLICINCKAKKQAEAKQNEQAS